MKVYGWPAFALWSLVGVLYAFAFLAVMSGGIFLLIVAGVTTAAAIRNLRSWPELIGLVAGPAAIAMWRAIRWWGFPVCGPGEQAYVTVSAEGWLPLHIGELSQRVGTLGCTGTDSRLLMAGGVLSAASAVIAYAMLRYSVRRMPHRKAA